VSGFAGIDLVCNAEVFFISIDRGGGDQPAGAAAYSVRAHRSGDEPRAEFCARSAGEDKEQHYKRISRG